MRNLTFNEFSQKNRERSNKHFKSQCLDWTLGDWGNALAGETGEACNLIKKFRRGETHDKDGTPIKEAIAKELADNIMYVDLIANEIGVNLEDIIRQKFNEVSNRKNSDIRL